MANTYSKDEKWIITLIEKVAARILGKRASQRIVAYVLGAGVLGKLKAKFASLIKAGKQGEITDLLNYVTSEKIAAREAGTKIPKWSELVKSYQDEINGKPLPKKWEDMTGKEKASSAAKKIGSAAGIIGAAVLALATINQAIRYGKDDANREDKSVWEWYWDTSIPGATVNLVASWFGHGRSQTTNGSKQASLNSQGELQLKSGLDDRVILRTPVVAKQESGNQVVEYEKNKKGSQNPPKTTSDKMVEYMKKTDKSFKNDANWYFQGLAAKLLSTTLTWTGLKDHTADYHFVPAAVIHVSLMLPTDSDRKLHHQVIANTNIEWQALRGKNTGAFNYTEEDVYTYNTTLAALIATARFTGKLLNLVNKHDPEVELLPQALLAGYACNFAARTNTGQVMYDDIIANRPQYLSQLNDICKEINTYALKGKTLISRWNYIADKCFRDYNGDKAVYGYYALRQVPSLTANGIGVTNLENSTIPQLLAYMKAQLDQIRTYNSGVLLKVAGDEIKLLGASTNTFANVPYFTGNEIYEFKYDPEAYDQIRNAKVLPWGVAQQPSYDRTVAAQYSVSLVSTTAIDPKYLGILQDEYEVVSERNKQFEAKENLQMIQFIPTITAKSMTPSSSIHLDIDDCPTTTMDLVVIALYDKVNGGIDTDVYCSIISDYNTASSPDIKLHGTISTQHSNAQGTAWMQEIGQIDFMPRYQMWKGDYSADFQATVIDVDNFAYITRKQVAQLNNVAVYSQTFVFNPEDLKIMGILVG